MAEAKAQQPQLEIQRIYVKDLSLEAPAAPEIFKKQWQPEVSVELDVNHKKLEENVYEVILQVTVSVKQEEKHIFLVEIHQAGIFNAIGFEAAQLDHLLGAYAPTVLFPYAREAISDAVMRASFPQLILAPVNFEALYMQRKEEEKAKSGSETKH